MAAIDLEHVTKIYPDGTRAVSDVSIHIPDGALIALVGPSGCGKTTLLRMIAGLDEPTEGEIGLDGRVVNGLPGKHRDVAMVFQNYALYPHMSVFDNMAFSLTVRRAKRSEINEKVRTAAEMLGLSDLLEKKPKQLSGGQRQRVAMGRAIVREPAVFLMDEPLSNLDAKLRVQMRAELARLQRNLAVTTVFVTHDQTEAMTLGDLAAVMDKGVLQQVAEPQVLYRSPANIFVAGFIGSPAMNFIQATLRRSGDGLSAEFGDTRLEVGMADTHAALAPYVGRKLLLGIRPEHMEDMTLVPAAPSSHRISSVVDIREEMGPESYVYFCVNGMPAPAEHVHDAVYSEDAAADIRATDTAESATQFIARFDANSTVREGDHVDVFVDSDHLHFFDLESGEAISRAAAASHCRHRRRNRPHG